MSTTGSGKVTRWHSDTPEGFEEVRLGRRRLILRREIAARAAEISERLNSVASSAKRGEGNRASGFQLRMAAAPELFVRLSRRGGMAALVVSSLYVGARPRPFDELIVAVEATRRGIPVAEPMGAVVEWLIPALYRGAVLTRFVEGSSLWQFLRLEKDPRIRAEALSRAAEAIETMHRRGLCHADLNLHNLLVAGKPGRLQVTIVDLDRARLHPGTLPERMRRANRARLLRSVRKLDPGSRYLDAGALALLGIG